MHKVFLNILPVILISMMVIYKSQTAKFAHSILGKLMACLLIIVYSANDIVYGVFVCALVILYYQTDYVEGFAQTAVSTVKDTFIQQNCKNGVLIHKSMPVKTEMAEHVFPELSFPRGTCNPCDKTCDIDIIEEKMTNEEELIAPKDSNDWVQDAWSKIAGETAKPLRTVNARGNAAFDTDKYARV